MVVGQGCFRPSRGWPNYACPFSLVPAEEKLLALLEVVPETDAHA